jgi:hypothetical protein
MRALLQILPIQILAKHMCPGTRMMPRRRLSAYWIAINISFGLLRTTQP